jgi:hypothetical protein
MKKCPSTSGENYSDTGPHDAGEFIQYIFNLFDVKGITYNKKTIGTNDMSDPPVSFEVTSQESTYRDPVIVLQAFELMSKEVIRTKDVVSHVEDSILDRKNLFRVGDRVYKRRIETIEISDAEFLVVYAMRTIQLGGNNVERIYTEIIPDKKVLGLDLFSIVVHEGGHYTAYINYGGYWYYYNDLGNKADYIGTYEEMLSNKRFENPKTLGVLYMYR